MDTSLNLVTLHLYHAMCISLGSPAKAIEKGVTFSLKNPLLQMAFPPVRCSNSMKRPKPRISRSALDLCADIVRRVESFMLAFKTANSGISFSYAPTACSNLLHHASQERNQQMNLNCSTKSVDSTVSSGCLAAHSATFSSTTLMSAAG